MAVGLALAKKIKGEKGRVFCLVGDGECNEGTTWESALIAAHHKLDNLTLIVDNNGSSERALSVNNLDKKFGAFGWFVLTVFEGNDCVHLETGMRKWKGENPQAVILNTVKGNGIPFMQDPSWHNRKLTWEEYNNAIYAIDGSLTTYTDA